MLEKCFSFKHLIPLLSKAGENYSPAKLESLIKGIAAAPDNFRFREWVRLVAARPIPRLEKELLHSLKQISLASDGLSHKTNLQRIKILRIELCKRNLDGYIIPKSDRHQGEYIARHSERLWWLTGFSGSAGVAVVLPRKAAIFVDGRYAIQVKQEVDHKIFSHEMFSNMGPADWIAIHARQNIRIGFDPWLLTGDQVNRYKKKFSDLGVTLIPTNYNPIDVIWSSQPARPISPVLPHIKKYAGETASIKKNRLTRFLLKENLDAAVLTKPDSICWLLNIRGNDIPFSPLVLCFAILHRTGTIELFVDRRKLTPKAIRHLGKEVEISGLDSLQRSLARLVQKTSRVRLETSSAPYWIESFLRKKGGIICKGNDPCQLPKSYKNSTEIDGARIAHERDGAALCTLFSWLDRTIKKGIVNELMIDERLERIRMENPNYRGPSFPAITASGPNGAIVHYRVTKETNRNLQNGELFLLDCGAQHHAGTTDVTRTIPIGTPTDEMRECYTRVLKGHIALATVSFPEGTTGSQLDVLARQYLWDAGLDFDHGTGHGVGSYLSVHEGPHRISKLCNNIPLEPGMIISNEPGYYKKSEFGIRIESLVLVTNKQPYKTSKRKILGFETLTLVPINLSLIKKQLMTRSEIEWLNIYHSSILEKIRPKLKKPDQMWLADATKIFTPN